MLDELDRDGDGLQAETGFGTGLRAHILGLHEGAEHDALPEPTLPPLPQPEPDPIVLELEQLRLRLERKEAALEEHERSLNVQAQALAAEAKRLADQKAELERHLDVRDLLRRRAEQGSSASGGRSTRRSRRREPAASRTSRFASQPPAHSSPRRTPLRATTHPIRPTCRTSSPPSARGRFN